MWMIRSMPSPASTAFSIFRTASGLAPSPISRLLVSTARIAAITTSSTPGTPSTVSSTDGARRAGTTVSSSASARATAPTTKPAQLGWCLQMPTESKNAAPNTPAAEAVTSP